jgi:pyruvate oxidase
MSSENTDGMVWYRVADLDELKEDSVKKVEAGGQSIALTRFESKYGALGNTCPHMGGPLGEGMIEYGLLSCPWHGREFHPLSGECEAHGEHVRTYRVEEREDGVYVAVEG